MKEFTLIVALFLLGIFSTFSFQSQPYIAKRRYSLGKFRRCATSTSSSTEKKSQTDQIASALVVTAATVASVFTMKVMVDAITPIITLSELTAGGFLFYKGYEAIDYFVHKEERERSRKIAAYRMKVANTIRQSEELLKELNALQSQAKIVELQLKTIEQST